MWALLVRNPVIRMLPRYAIIVPLVALQATWVRSFAVASRGERLLFGSPLTETVVWVLILWVPVFFFVAFAGTARRADDLALALPLPARRLWSSHLAGTLVSGLCVLALSVAALYASILGTERWTERVGRMLVAPDLLRLGLRVGSGLVLAVVGFGAFDPSLSKVSVTRRYLLLSAGVLVGVGAMVVALESLPLAVILVPLAVAYVLSSWAYRSLPGVLSVVPAEAASGGGYAVRPGGGEWAVGGEEPRLGGAWMTLTTVLRAYSRNVATPFFAWPLLFIVGWTLTGNLLDDESLRFTTPWITAYMLIIFSALALQGLTWLDALPVSRRYLFAALVVPAFVCIGLGYGTGTVARWLGEPEGEAVRFQGPEHHLFVPLDACRIAWDGDVPESTSPWGESHPMWSVPVIRGSRAAVYSPFGRTDESTLEFVALQISRAVDAVYGEDISAEEIAERYLTVDSAGKVVPKTGGMNLREDFPDLRRRGRGPIAPFLSLLVGLPWLLLLAPYLRRVRIGTPERTRKALLWGFAGLCLGMYVLPLPLVESGLVRLWVMVGFVEILIRRLGALPGGTLIAWVGCGLLLIAAYRVAEREFENIEVWSEIGKEARLIR